MYGYINAIVLNDSYLGEIDRLYKVFSDKLGEVNIIARRGYLSRYPFSGILNSLNYVRILLFKGGISDSYYIMESEIISEFKNIKRDQDLLIPTYYILYVTDNLFRESTSDVYVFKMLLTFLNILDSGTELDLNILRDSFLWKLAVHLGFSPGLTHCYNCNQESKSDQVRFSISSGGLVCPECSGPELEFRNISRGSLNFLKRMVSGELKDNLSLKYTGLASRELNSLSEDYLRYHSERGFLLYRDFSKKFELKKEKS